MTNDDVNDVRTMILEGISLFYVAPMYMRFVQIPLRSPLSTYFMGNSNCLAVMEYEVGLETRKWN